MEETPLQFLHEIEKLKHLPRTGWLRTIENPESVAAHSHRVAMMAWLAPDDLNLDGFKCMKMALFHDLAESVIGDIPTFANVPKEQKNEMERNGFQYLESLLRPFSSQKAKEILALWEEYEVGESPEAKWVREMDKFDCLMQAHEYEQRTYGKKDLTEFQGQSDKIHSPEAKKWLEQLQQERGAHLNKRKQWLPIIFVTGISSGTGDLDACKRISDHVSEALKLPHVSVKELLREKAADQSYHHSNFLQDCLDRDLDVPVGLVVGLLETEIRQHIGEERQWMLVSGFPKNREHLEEFEKKVQNANYTIFLQYAGGSRDPEPMNSKTDSAIHTWKPSTVDFKNHLKNSMAHFNDFTGPQEELLKLSKESVNDFMNSSKTDSSREWGSYKDKLN